MLKDFSLSRLRFMLEPEWRLALHPRNPGNTLRGAFQLHVQATGLPDSSRLPRYLPPENHLSVRPDLRTESAAGNRPPPPESGYSSPFVFRPPWPLVARHTDYCGWGAGAGFACPGTPLLGRCGGAFGSSTPPQQNHGRRPPDYKTISLAQCTLLAPS